MLKISNVSYVFIEVRDRVRIPLDPFPNPYFILKKVTQNPFPPSITPFLIFSTKGSITISPRFGDYSCRTNNIGFSNPVVVYLNS